MAGSRHLHTWLLMVAIWLASAFAGAGDLSLTTRAEIDHLLVYLKDSGCSFERNGKWYDADDAERHINRKLNWLLKRDLVDSAEQFIERAATASSRSGQPYHVKCADGEPVTSSAWFRAELERLRTQADKREAAGG
jgi:Family of unknown function (DUF5329)